MENHKRMPWHSRTVEEVLGELDTSEGGLSNAEAARRLKENGFNELHQKKNKTLLEISKSQIIDPMILILIASSIISLILREYVEGFAILFIVILNAVIGVVQDKKAESSIEALKSMSAPSSRVLREGDERLIPSRDLVVGDIIIIDDGSMIPADIRLIDSSNLKVQESALTGESVSAEKEAEDILSIDCALGDRSNLVYTSSIVTYGRAIGVVVATGMDTEVGNIANMLEDNDN